MCWISVQNSICFVLEPMISWWKTTEINQFSQILLADPGPSYFIGAQLKSPLKNLLKSLPLVLNTLARRLNYQSTWDEHYLGWNQSKWLKFGMTSDCCWFSSDPVVTFLGKHCDYTWMKLIKVWDEMEEFEAYPGIGTHLDDTWMKLI